MSLDLGRYDKPLVTSAMSRLGTHLLQPKICPALFRRRFNRSLVRFRIGLGIAPEHLNHAIGGFFGGKFMSSTIRRRSRRRVKGGDQPCRVNFARNTIQCRLVPGPTETPAIRSVGPCHAHGAQVIQKCGFQFQSVAHPCLQALLLLRIAVPRTVANHPMEAMELRQCIQCL